MTKYIGGHGNSMGGIIVDGGRFDWFQSDKFPALTEPTKAYHGIRFAETFGDFGFAMRCKAVGLRDVGPCLSPFNAFMLLTGCETLPLRMQRHVENATAVAEFLAGHPAVAWVSYPGLPGSPHYELARRYMPRGTGAVFTFGVKGGYEMGIKVVEGCELLSHLANIGDTRSLIIHPASTTHRQLDEAQLRAAGAGPEVIRLSIGLETASDIIADLDQALAAAAAPDPGERGLIGSERLKSIAPARRVPLESSDRPVSGAIGAFRSFFHGLSGGGAGSDRRGRRAACVRFDRDAGWRFEQRLDPRDRARDVVEGRRWRARRKLLPEPDRATGLDQLALDDPDLPGQARRPGDHRDPIDQRLEAQPAQAARP